MKTFTKILTAAAATALLATGCVNEDPAYKNNEPGTPPDPNAKGYLTLADMSMRVVVDTDTETRPDDTSDETAKPQTRTDEAQPDVDTFIIEIRDATGKLALQETYGDLKVSIGEAGRLELPVGGYTMEVRSEEAATTPAAEWEHPVYFGSQEFVIEKNQTTPINEVVCTLNNIKVTLMCSKDLADQLTADTKSTVTLGETTMTFLKDETRAAYFMPQGETNTLKLHLEGAFADTPDAPVRINKSISGVKAGQWRKLLGKLGLVRPADALPPDRNILHFGDPEKGSGLRTSELALHEGQQFAAPTRTLPREDPSIGETTPSANQRAYAEDAKQLIR